MEETHLYKEHPAVAKAIQLPSLPGVLSPHEFVEQHVTQDMYGVPPDQHTSLYNTKVKDKVLMLNNPGKTFAAPKQPQPQKLNHKCKKRLRPFLISKQTCKYKDFMPLHELWSQYFFELLNLQSGFTASKLAGLNLSGRLLKADFHGAIIKVTRSKCPTLVGLEGILIQETERTFRIVTQQDQLKCLPKKNSVFSVEFQGLTFSLYGNHLQYRSSERAVSKRFKPKPTIDL
eukprot:m.4664 g.4664  ORF g.4664 m.4664 type:complete len:231 (+) comp5120_c0_seq1:86-778(+)